MLSPNKVASTCRLDFAIRQSSIDEILSPSRVEELRDDNLKSTAEGQAYPNHRFVCLHWFGHLFGQIRLGTSLEVVSILGVAFDFLVDPHTGSRRIYGHRRNRNYQDTSLFPRLQLDGRQGRINILHNHDGIDWRTFNRSFGKLLSF